MIDTKIENRVGYSYEEAFDASFNYFGADELAANVFLDKYALRDNDGVLLESTPFDMHKRMAKEFARIQKKKYGERGFKENELLDMFDGFKYIIPQGSPMFGIGNPYQYVSLSNCFVIESPVDSYGAILKADEQLVQISKRRGGVGVDLSYLRPSGTTTHNAARTSTGIVSWMERYSNSIREVAQNGRRGALMLTLDVHHPDSYQFIKIKNDRTKVTAANISLRISDDFMFSVEEDSTIKLKWRPSEIAPYLLCDDVKARTIWDDIIQNAHAMAEPGVLFWDTIIRESVPDCYSHFGFRTISTNPCGEITLCANDSCRLLVVNLFSFVVNPFTKDAYFDWDKFAGYVRSSQRLMDDIVDLEIEAIDRIIAKIKDDPESREIKSVELELWKAMKQVASLGRRTGTGQTALGDCLAALGIGYGSQEGLEFIDRVYRELKLESYRASVEMAKELGSFPIWDHELEKNNPFLLRIKDEDPKLWEDMKKYGRRNIALLTTAPVGSVSILTQTTSGFEPLFMLDPIIRRKKINPGDKNFRSDFVDQNGDHWMEFKIHHPKVAMWMDITKETDLTKSPWYGYTSHDINWEMRVKAQGIAQKHVDHSISSTVNLPEDVSVQEVEKIYMTAWKEGLKGITIYRDNCRTGVLVKETKKPESVFESHSAPKRPKELPCDVYHFNVKNKPFFVIVGKLNDKPYEVFASVNENETGETLIPKNYNHGICFKEGRGHYKVKLENCTVDPIIIKKIDNQLDENEAALARMISTALRHGADVQFVVHQLEKIEGSLFGFCKAIAKALKKYIQDGTEVKGEVCPKCGCENCLIRQEGCVQCKACGWSKC